MVDGRLEKFRYALDGDTAWVSNTAGTWAIRSVAEASVRGDVAHSGDAEILSPMPGSVIAVLVSDGGSVTVGRGVVVVEAMKMEHTLTTPIDGTAEIAVSVGDQVRVDQLLARVVPESGDVVEVER